MSGEGDESRSSKPDLSPATNFYPLSQKTTLLTEQLVLSFSNLVMHRMVSPSYKHCPTGRASSLPERANTCTYSPFYKIPKPSLAQGCSLHPLCPPGTHLEAEDDGPDEAQDQAVVAIHNVVGAHVLQVHTLLLQELQGLVHILQAVDAHLPLRGLWLRDSIAPWAWKNLMVMPGPTPVISIHPPCQTPTPTLTP